MGENPGDSDNFDGCECLFSHEFAMRRLISFVSSLNFKFPEELSATALRSIVLWSLAPHIMPLIFRCNSTLNLQSLRLNRR